MSPRLVLLTLSLLLLATAVDSARAPWRRRRRPDIEANRAATARIFPEDWDAEPPSPAEVEVEPLAGAIRALCGWMPPGRASRYAGWIIESAAEFGEDPFLLGALIHRMGRCNPRAEGLGGLGLTLIPRRMYGDHLRRGLYTYFVQGAEGWQEETLRVDRYPFAEPRLTRPRENIYFAAAILSVWRTQHASVDGMFEQHPHRHYVSHFIWGDRVISDRAEDRVLTDRRRLLEYYGAREPVAPRTRLGLEMGAPLDGAPRVISSWIGDVRDDGARSHRGIDVESVLGEPVRAVADGRVNFAGVDYPGARANENLTPEEIEAVPRSEMGNGGRYVCILHRPEGGGWVRSCYMHLEDVAVEWGQEVRRGERIGTVGRTGMRRSAPHLHFELHSPEGLVDASEVLAGTLMGHEPDPEPRRRR